MSNNIKLFVGVLATTFFVFSFGASALNCPEGVDPCEHDKQCGACSESGTERYDCVITCGDWENPDGTWSYSWSGTCTEKTTYSCGFWRVAFVSKTGSGSGHCSDA